jgi:hypothetical protein
MAIDAIYPNRWHLNICNRSQFIETHTAGHLSVISVATPIDFFTSSSTYRSTLKIGTRDKCYPRTPAIELQETETELRLHIG